MPKVSIIVPIYNVIPYLKECLDSILVQTFSDFELILVDDGSTDGSERLADSYALSDPRVKVVYKENGGLSSARNAGLDLACGEYIYFVDSDDYIEPDTLEKTVPYMDSGYDMVAFNYRFLGVSHTRKINSRCSTHIKETSSITLSCDEDRISFLMGPQIDGTVHWEAWNRLFRHDIIENNHIRFADNRKIFAEDLYFQLCYDAFISKVLLIPDILYNYRLRDDSIMSKSDGILFIRQMNELGNEVWSFYDSNERCRYLSEHFLPVFARIQNLNLWRLQEVQYKRHLTITQARSILKEEVSDYELFRKRLTEIYMHKDLRYRIFHRDKVINSAINRIFIKELLDMPETGIQRFANSLFLKVTEVLRKIKRGAERALKK